MLFSSVKNSFNGLQFGFAYPASDYVRRKYRIGELKLKNTAGEPIQTNVHLQSARARIDPSADPDDENGCIKTG